MLDNEVDLQGKAQNFLLMKYPDAKVTFSSAQLATKEGNLIYQLAGTIEMKSRSGLMDRFTPQSHPNRFSLNIELDAKQGSIFNYELR